MPCSVYLECRSHTRRIWSAPKGGSPHYLFPSLTPSLPRPPSPNDAWSSFYFFQHPRFLHGSSTPPARREHANQSSRRHSRPHPLHCRHSRPSQPSQQARCRGQREGYHPHWRLWLLWFVFILHLPAQFADAYFFCDISVDNTSLDRINDRYVLRLYALSLDASYAEPRGVH